MLVGKKDIKISLNEQTEKKVSPAAAAAHSTHPAKFLAPAPVAAPVVALAVVVVAVVIITAPLASNASLYV